MADWQELPAPETHNARNTLRPERPAFSGMIPHAQAFSSMQTPTALYFDETQSTLPSFNLHRPFNQDYGHLSQPSHTPVGLDPPLQWYTETSDMHGSVRYAQGPQVAASQHNLYAPIPRAAAGASRLSTFRTTSEQLDGSYLDSANPINLAQAGRGLSQIPAQHERPPFPLSSGRHEAQSFQPSRPSPFPSPQGSMGYPAIGSSHASPSATGGHGLRQTTAQPALPATPSRLQSTRSRPSQKSMTRRVAPRSRVREAKDMTKLVTRLSPGQAQALITSRQLVPVAADKKYVNQFRSKQEALEYLSRLSGGLQYHRLPTSFQIKKRDIDSERHLAILQHFLDAIREAPDQNELPHYLSSEDEKHNFVRKNHEQYQQCLQKLKSLTDSSACVYLLLQMLIDVYDEEKGIPRGDLEPDLRTSQGKHKLEIDVSFYEKVALIGDILKRYKWVGKDVLNNNNILLIVVATESYLRTKLNNCDSNGTRQDWKDKEMKSKGVTKPKAKIDKPSAPAASASTQPASQGESGTGSGTTVGA